MTKEEFIQSIIPMRDKLKEVAVGMTGDDNLAEDTVQEVMLKLWSMRQSLDRYDNKHGLAVTMLRNRIKDHWRHRKFENGMPERLNDMEADTPDADTADEVKLISIIIEHLPPLQGKLFRMKEIEGYDSTEIMEITGCTAESLRQNLSRARRKIIADYAKMTRKRVKNEQATEKGQKQ